MPRGPALSFGLAGRQWQQGEIMAEATPNGLMAFWANIESDYESRFLEWHNCEHMPERVSVPGFREGRRYHGIGDAPAFLMMYFTDNADVLQSDAYVARLNDPTPWTQESLTHFRDPSRNVYDLAAEAGDGGLLAAPYIVSIRFDASEPTVEELTAKLLPAWAALDEVGRVRLYAINAAISGIETAERSIYGGGPGAQQYLLLVECALAGTPDTEVWRAAWRAATGNGAAVAHVLEERFWIDYALAKP